MRHRKTVNHLGRTSAHRKAMMSNMATSLIMHKRIKTTLAKAKALRVYVEPIITRSKEDTTHNRREVFSYLQDNKAVTELFRVVSQKVADRPGGYTRILKTENRLGDNAQMCIIELVDFNELYVTDTTTQKGAKRTRRAGAKKTGAETVAAAPVAAAVKEEVAPIIEEEVQDEVVIEETPIADVSDEDQPEAHEAEEEENKEA
jgi:large subunit ribosomal protein L17